MSVKKINFKHGHTSDYTESSEYNSWCHMKERCYNPNSKFFKYYGGRGIKTCERWLNSFENFIEDMGLKPSKLHSLDRFPNNNGDYEKTNCRWATKKEQANNKRSTMYINYNNDIKSLKEWCEILELNYKKTHKRIKYYGWSIERAFFDPPIPQDRLIEFNGKKQSVSAWARELGIIGSTLSSRLNHLGLSVEDAFNPKSRVGNNQFSN